METQQHSAACSHTRLPRELLHNPLVSQGRFSKSVIMGKKSQVLSENRVFGLHTHLLPMESCQTTLCKTCLQNLLWVTHSYVSWKNWANGPELRLPRVPRSWTIRPGRSQCTETFLYSLQGGLRPSKTVSCGVCKNLTLPFSKDAYRTPSSFCSLFNSHFMLPQHAAGAGPGPGDLRQTRPVLSREEHSTGELWLS